MDESSGIISLRRTLSILLIVYGLGVLTAFLAGATLVAHADPTSECILFSYAADGKLFYGSEAYCESIGYLFLSCVIGCVIMFYLTFKHRRAVNELFKSGQYVVKTHDEDLKLKKKLISIHALGAFFVFALTIALTSGYSTTCSNLQEFMRGVVNEKKASLHDGHYRDTIDEKFEHDNEFWHYNKKITSKHQNTRFITKISIQCRALFTDPGIHQKLHDSHREKYQQYFGYWYNEDLDLNYDPRSEAIYTNVLIEASLAGGWISVCLWVGSLVFMLIQRFYLKKNKQKAFDRQSLHSGADGTLRKEDMSMMSGSYFQDGGTLSRGGTLRGSDRSVRSTRRRGDMDDLALSLHGVMSTGTPSYGGSLPYQQPPSYQSQYPSNHPSQQTYPTYPTQPPSYHTNPPTHLPQYESEPMNFSLQGSGRAYVKPSHPDTTYYEREHVETEIM